MASSGIRCGLLFLEKISFHNACACSYRILGCVCVCVCVCVCIMQVEELELVHNCVHTTVIFIPKAKFF